MNKKIIAAMIWSFVCLFAFVSVGIAAPISFTETKYTTAPDSILEVPVTLDYTGLNTTATDIISGYGTESDGDGGYIPLALTDDEISDITDFDRDTYYTITTDVTGGFNITGIGYYWFNIQPINSFGGMWMKKSYSVGAYVMMMNNTAGLDSLAYPQNIGAGYPYFNEYSNESYIEITGLETMDAGLLTFPEYVDTYGSIDNVSVWFSYGGPFMSGQENVDFAPSPPDSTLALNWYEFHLYNPEPTITSAYVEDGEGIGQAWGIGTERASAGHWVVTLKIPETASLGSYFLVVEDSLRNYDQVSVEIAQSQTNIWTWIYPISCWLIGIGIIGAADLLADTKKNKIGVTLLAAIGILIFAIGVLMATDIVGWTSIGLLPIAIVAGLKSRTEAIKEFVRKHKKVIAAFGIITCLAFVASIVPYAMATTNEITISPDSITAKPGDKVSFTYKSSDLVLNTTWFITSVQKVDTDTPFSVHWTTTYTLDTAKLNATVKITIPESADVGTYNVVVYCADMGTEYATIYIAGEPSINWQIFGFFELTGVIFIGILALGWGHAKKTRTLADDIALICVGVAGLAFILIGIAYLMGWLETYLGIVFDFAVRIKAMIGL